MTIRTRLGLWYGAILAISLSLLAAVFHHELVERSQSSSESNLPMDTPWGETVEVVIGYGLPTATVMLVGGWWLTRKILSPINRLTDSAGQLHAGNLSQRLPRSGNGDELDRLTDVFNGMIGRLEDSFQRVHEFTLHASHELKTPLTVLHAELETELRSDSLTAVDREKLEGRFDEVQRLVKIVDGLTLLARADAGELALIYEPVRLDELVREAHEDTQVLAIAQGLRVWLEAPEPAVIMGDRHRLRQVLLNLGDNAVKYNRPGGEIHFRLHRAANEAVLQITNTSVGVPAEFQSKVFDRFYRGDSSHNREIDGCGLGLSIAQSIVRSHGGQIEFSSRLNDVTTVSVRLPLKRDDHV